MAKPPANASRAKRSEMRTTTRWLSAFNKPRREAGQSVPSAAHEGCSARHREDWRAASGGGSLGGSAIPAWPPASPATF
eukprot:scaffold5855_cov117-Isochrysis_galbana.AAC.11